MELISNINTLKAKLAILKGQLIGGVYSDALIGGLSAAKSIMDRRIFNIGEDINGVKLGGYSTNYAKYRSDRGRQSNKKDLQFSGSLKSSIVVLTINNNKAVIKINNPLNTKIARGQENQISNLRVKRKGNTKSASPISIFYLSKEEQLIMKETTKRLILQKIKI